ncbi:DNA helicase UvrD [Candidatus Woesearchaeota archaeon]|nr:DNA helicase UvrD [Candidatus Woesearchaeota archaeon]
MIIADLQIHSRYARACSNNTTLDLLEKYARIKGLDLIGTGDFQHPLWNKEIKEKLKEDDNGIIWSKTKFPFIWQTEISLMYKQDGKGRRIHHLIFSPNKDVADQIIDFLGSKGRLDYDGRPIFGFSSIELVDFMRNISNDIEIIPAHVMTPYFGLYGSKTGFDSLKDCFKDNTKHIHAIESGMSADPPMLWRLKEDINIVSFSDAHSYWPWRLGREATVFDCELKYKDIINSIRTKNKISYTIETVPDYGKYHYDGHRNCNLRLSPEETRKLEGICPKCNQPLTIGVQYRIEELAKEPEGYNKKDPTDYKRLIPLHELISSTYNIKQISSKKVWEIYNKLIAEFGNEFKILLEVPYEDLIKIIQEKLAKVIIMSREDKLKILPGYDGTYGEIILDKEKIIEEGKKQKTLGEF